MNDEIRLIDRFRYKKIVFSPEMLEKNVLWFHAYDKAYLNTKNNSITKWSDCSIKKNHLVSTSSNYDFKTNIQTYNFKNIPYQNGTSQLTTSTCPFTNSINNNYLFYIVFKLNEINNSTIFKTNNNSIEFKTDNGNLYLLSSTNSTINLGLVSPNVIYFCSIRIYLNTLIFTINGESYSYTISTFINLYNSGNFLLGGGNITKISFYELIAYEQQHNNYFLNSIDTYVKEKWTLYNTWIKNLNIVVNLITNGFNLVISPTFNNSKYDKTMTDYYITITNTTGNVVVYNSIVSSNNGINQTFNNYTSTYIFSVYCKHNINKYVMSNTYINNQFSVSSITPSISSTNYYTGSFSATINLPNPALLTLPYIYNWNITDVNGNILYNGTQTNSVGTFTTLTYTNLKQGTNYGFNINISYNGYVSLTYSTMGQTLFYLPTDMSNAVGWFITSDTSTTKSGSTITGVKNKINNEYSNNQGTVNTSSYNGFTTASFTPSNNYIRGPALINRLSNNFCFISVFKTNNVNTQQIICGQAQNGESVSGRIATQFISNDGTYGFNGRFRNQYLTTILSANTWFISALKVDGTSNGCVTLYLNNSKYISSGGLSGLNIKGIPDNNTYFGIGGLGISSQYFNGEILEVIVLSSSTSDSDIEKCITSLNRKYSIYTPPIGASW